MPTDESDKQIQQPVATSETSPLVESHTANPPKMPPTAPKTSHQPAAKSTSRKWGAAIIVVLLACFGVGYAGSQFSRMTENNGSSNTASFDKVANDGNLTVTPAEQTISSIVEKVSPSVVSIVTTLQSDRMGYQEQAAGTGMIVSSDGYVMTNNHVISGSTNVTVVTSSGKTYKDVKVLGKDPLNDVAFLKIPNVSGLPTVEIGDSKTVRTGQSVIAIGNALGQYQNTVTSGIISGLGRPVVASDGQNGSDSESLSDLLQTDAAINSGNSGGPLLNMKGQVIGINTAVAQDAQSIGFAIPIGATKGILKHLIQTGKVERAVVGLQYVSITPEVQNQYNLSVTQGDYVTATSGQAIKVDSPAAAAGIQDKDIITKVNDVTVGPGKSVSTLVGEFQPGDTVKLTILRDGQTLVKSVTLTSY